MSSRSTPTEARAVPLFAVLLLSSTGLGALLGGMLPALARHAPPWPALRDWWLADLVGLFVGVPLVVTWMDDDGLGPRLGGRLLTELAAILGIFLALSLFVELGATSRAGFALEHAYLFFPLHLWCTLRFGPRGGATMGTLISIVAIHTVVRGHGQGAPLDGSLSGPIAAVQLFCVVIMASGHAALTIIAERRRFEERLLLASRAAEAASQAKSEFLANMSHELRTPLTAILGYSEELLTAAELGTERHATVRIIHRNGDHLLTLLNDILDLSKIEAGKLDVERIPCAPRRVLQDVLRLLQVRAEGKRVTLSWEQQGPLPGTVRTDPTRLRQVLLNLAGNAIKFTERGGVLIMASLQDGAAPRLCFDVTDTGVGLSPEQATRLFQPFGQADTSTTRQFGGTGLGLVISRRLARLLGGDVELLRSAPGQGSTFRLLIDPGPLDGVALEGPGAARERSGAPAPPRPQRRLDGYRVLLVDDSADNRLLISTVLKRAGAQVRLAQDGRQATEVALGEDGGFDVILMDMMMPVMDGYSAARLLRERGYRRPIVALTANAMASDERRCLEAGCSGYATKPIDRVALLDTIADQVGGAQTA